MGCGLIGLILTFVLLGIEQSCVKVGGGGLIIGVCCRTISVGSALLAIITHIKECLVLNDQLLFDLAERQAS